ncbi:MAG: glycosyltransferase family 4 protein [Patescibacteria group bacterium]|nr:glycosyltransferase family 4 protein [Patescibacteria group bacterium]
MIKFNIAFEVTPLLDANALLGTKSGIYRCLYNQIKSLSLFLRENNLPHQIFLFTLSPHLEIYFDLLDELKKLQNVNLIHIGSNPKGEISGSLNFSERVNLELFFEKDIYKKNKPLFFFKKLLSRSYKLTQTMAKKESFIRHLDYLDSFFNQNQIRVIHHSETGFYFFKNKKNIITFHDFTPLTHPQFHQEETKTIFLRKMYFTQRYVDGIQTVSSSTEKQARKFFPKKIIKTVYNIVNKEEIIKKSTVSLSTISKTLKINLKPKNYFVFYGTFEPRKNIIALINTFLDLHSKKKLFNHQLILIGGEGWLNIKEKAKGIIIDRLYSLERSPVKILDYLSDEYLFSILKNSAGLIYPSFAEGFGFQIVEAAILKVPIICSEIDTFREIAPSTSFFFNPERISQELKEILTRKLKNFSPKDSDEKKLERFSPKKVAKELFDFYQSFFI